MYTCKEASILYCNVARVAQISQVVDLQGVL